MKEFFGQAFGRPASARPVGALWDGVRLWAARAPRRAEEGAAEVSWSGSRPEASAALRRAGLDREPAQAVLSQEVSLAKRLRFPSTDPAELRDMAVLAAARQLPLPPEDLLTDLRVLETDREGNSLVLLFVARREDVLAWTAVYREAGLRVERLLPAAAAVEPLLAAAAAPGETVIGVEAGPSSVLVAVCRGGAVRFARGFPWGRDLSRLEKELRQTLLAYEREEPLSEPVRVLGWASEGGDAFRAALSKMVPWQVDAFPPQGGDGLPPSVRGAVLAASRAPDLLPTEERKALSRAGRRREAAVFSALVLLAAAVAGAGAAGRTRRLERRLADLDARWRGVSSEARELEALDRRLRRLHRPGKSSELPGLLAALNKQLPPRVTLVSLTYERDKGALLQGAALSLADAVGAANALERSGLYKDVDLRSSNARPSHGQDVVEFEIRLGFLREETLP